MVPDQETLETDDVLVVVYLVMVHMRTLRISWRVVRR